MTYGAFTAGSAHLLIGAKLKPGFRTEVKSLVANINPTVTATIKPKLQSGFKTELRSLLNAATAGLNAQVGVKVNTSTVRTQIRDSLKNLPKVKLAVDLDFTQANRDLAAFRASVAAQPLSLNVNVDTSAALAQLIALRSLATSVSSAAGGISVQGGQAARRQIERSLGGPIRRIRIRIETDRASIAQAQSEVANVTSRLEAARQREADAADRVRLAQQRLDEVMARANSTQSARMAATQALARAQRELAARTSEHHSLLGRQASAHQRLTEAMRRGSGVMRLVNAGVAGLAFRAGQAGMGVLRMNAALVSAIGPGQLLTTALKALALVSLVPLAGQVAHVGAALAALAPAAGFAATSVTAALVIGSQGIVDVFKAQAKVSENAAQDAETRAKKIEAASRQQENAERGLADARKQAARTAVDGQRQIASAQKAYNDSLKREQDAQKDLSRARRDAARELQDINRELEGSTLDERDAELSVREAEKAVRDLFKDGRAVDPIDLERALLGVDQARDRVDDVRARNQRLREDAAKANKDGVEGSDRVVDAKQRAADATDSVREAEENLQHARVEADQANEDAQQRISEAQREVAHAQKEMSDALTETSSAVKDLERELAKLSPSARDFFEKVSGLSGAWSDLRREVQQNLFNNLGAPVVELADRQLPNLKSGLAGIADEINTGVRAALKFLATDAAQNDLKLMFDSTRTAVRFLIDGLGDLGAILWDVAAVGATFLPGLGESFKNTTSSWRDEIHRLRQNGDLAKFIGTGIEKFKQMLDILEKVAGIITKIFGGSNEVGEDWLDSIQKTLTAWNDYLGTEKGREDIKKFFNDVKSIVEAILSAIQTGAKILGTFRPADEPKPQDRTAPGTPGDGGYGPDGVDRPGRSPERLEPGAAQEAGFLRQIWDAPDNDQGWKGKAARGFNSLFGLNNETDQMDGGVWRSDRWGGELLSFGNNWLTIWGLNENALQPAMQFVENTFNDIKSSVTSWASELGTDIKNSVSGAWDGLVNKITDGWKSNISPTLDRFREEGIGGLANAFLEKITFGAVTDWERLPKAIGNGVKDIVDRLFPGLTDALGKLPGAFGSAASAIGAAFSTLGGLLTTPINAAIDALNALGDAWNVAAKFLHLEEWKPIPHVGGGKNLFGNTVYKPQPGGHVGGRWMGGPINGPGTKTSDSILGLDMSGVPTAWVSAGEHVWTADEVTAAGGHRSVEQLRAAAKTGAFKANPGNYRAGGVVLPHLAIGGGVEFGSDADRWMADVIQKAFADAVVTSGYRAGHSGFHGKGQAIDIDGPNKQAYADWIYNAYPQSEQLIWGPGPLLYNVGGQFITDQAQLAQVYAGDLPGHFDHVHWANDTPLGNLSDEDRKSLLDRVKSGIGGVVGRARNYLLDKAISVFENPVRDIVNRVPAFSELGMFGQLPKAFISTLAEHAIGFVRAKAGVAGGGSGGGGGAGYVPSGGVEQWRDLAKDAMRRTGFNADDERQVNAMMAQIQSESGGNPGIIQQVQDVNSGGNEAVGLLQVIPGTFAAHRDPSLPDDRTDPLANMVAALRYYRSRYGGDLTTYWGQGHGYDNGGWLPDGGFGFNKSGKPEPVFTDTQWQILKELVESLTVAAPGIGQFAPILSAVTPGGMQLQTLERPIGVGEGSEYAGGVEGADLYSTGRAGRLNPLDMARQAQLPWYATANPGATIAERSVSLAQSQAQGLVGYIQNNWKGMLDTAAGVAVGGLGGSGVTVHGGIHTTNWGAAERALTRRQNRASRAAQRAGWR